MTLNVIETYLFDIQVLPENADNKKVTWSSSNEQVVSVDKDGNVTAHEVGEAWIKATSEDNPEAKDSCKVVVLQPVSGISLSQENYTFDRIGASYQLKAIVEPEDASKKEVTWKSYNESVCIVNTGLVIATGYGSTIVTATTVEGGYMAYCTITVTDNTPVRDIDPETSGYKVYDLQGRECKRLQKGINIIRFSDGSTKKVLNK